MWEPFPTWLGVRRDRGWANLKYNFVQNCKTWQKTFLGTLQGLISYDKLPLLLQNKGDVAHKTFGSWKPAHGVHGAQVSSQCYCMGSCQPKLMHAVVRSYPRYAASGHNHCPGRLVRLWFWDILVRYSCISSWMEKHCFFHGNLKMSQLETRPERKTSVPQARLSWKPPICCGAEPPLLMILRFWIMLWVDQSLEIFFL